MKSFRLASALVLLCVFSRTLLQADTTINVASSALGNGQPGENGPIFSFTTVADGVVTVKAMFMTHWLTNRGNVAANPKATRFIIDGASYPSPASPEDFYGYMDGRIWPERVARIDQQVWIQETFSLPSGLHTIQFRNV